MIKQGKCWAISVFFWMSGAVGMTTLNKMSSRVDLSWLKELEAPDERTFSQLGMETLPSEIEKYLNDPAVEKEERESRQVYRLTSTTKVCSLFEQICKQENIPLISLLLEKGFNPKARVGPSKLESYLSLANERYPALATLLVDHGAPFVWKKGGEMECWAALNWALLNEKCILSHPYSFLSYEEIKKMKEHRATVMVLYRKLGPHRSLGKLSKDVLRRILFFQLYYPFLEERWAERGACFKMGCFTGRYTITLEWAAMNTRKNEIEIFKKDKIKDFQEHCKRLGLC